MKSLYLFAAAAFAVAPHSAAHSQAAPLMVGTPVPANVLQRGTEIRMVTLKELNSNDSKVGDRFDLEVVEDVRLGGRVVIPAGARGVGEVTLAKRKGMWGKSGRLQTQLLYLRMGDRQLRISGSAGGQGKTGTAGVVASVALLPIAGFLVTGTSAVIPPRTATVASLEEEVPVTFATAAPVQPLVVGEIPPPPPQQSPPQPK